MAIYTTCTGVPCHTIHLNNQFIMQLSSIYRKYAWSYHTRGQSTDISHVLSKMGCKCLFTSCTRVNPPTKLSPTIIEYNTPLY
jgi:hypothetical protein